MRSSNKSKRVSHVVLGILFAGSLAILALPGQNAIAASEPTAPMVEIIQPLHYDYRYFTQVDKTNYYNKLKAQELEAKAQEIQALYATKAVPAVVALGTHEPERLMAPVVKAEPVKTVAPYKLPSAKTDPAAYWFVNANTLNVRSGPGTDYDKVATLAQGDKVGFYKKEGQWVVIRTESGKVGCVLLKYLVENEASISRQATATSSEVTSLAQQIVDYSQTLAGIKYVYGGYSTKGFDCSGFTKYVYAHFGITIPRSSADYASFGVKVSRENLRPSDILLFDTDGGGWDVSHVGIYLGGDKFIHASTSKRKVIVMTLSEYRGKYYGARRVID